MKGLYGVIVVSAVVFLGSVTTAGVRLIVSQIGSEDTVIGSGRVSGSKSALALPE